MWDVESAMCDKKKCYIPEEKKRGQVSTFDKREVPL